MATPAGASAAPDFSNGEEKEEVSKQRLKWFSV